MGPNFMQVSSHAQVFWDVPHVPEILVYGHNFILGIDQHDGIRGGFQHGLMQGDQFFVGFFSQISTCRVMSVLNPRMPAKRPCWS